MSSSAPAHKRQPARPEDYEARKQNELRNFADDVEVHALPESFHYWSNKYLRPRLEAIGCNSPDDFFFQEIKAQASEHRRPIRVISIGCGNADVELGVMQRLREAGVANVTLVAMDINPDMLARGRDMAAELGLSDQLECLQADFNDWRPSEQYDVILANQSLHHVVDLESLFAAAAKALTPGGRFITSDMIGRNGHMRWPEAEREVRRLWRQLPAAKHFNHQTREDHSEFVNFDCSVDNFEGIRAQDILPLLLHYFDFEVFVGFGNIIDVFIDRGYGPNFDPENADDRQFIDDTHALDERLMVEGRITPTHMIARLRGKGEVRHPTATAGGLSPEQSVRLGDAV